MWYNKEYEVRNRKYKIFTSFYTLAVIRVGIMSIQAIEQQKRATEAPAGPPPLEPATAYRGPSLNGGMKLTRKSKKLKA
jgi:hypothetical protein